MQTFQTRHAPETVTSCCKLQAAGVWFRTTLQGRPSRPPSRPAHGTKVNTLPVQGRVSQRLAASLHSKDQATHCQADSSNPYRSPGLPFVPQMQTFQTRHAPETVTSCCKLQAAGVWFRTTLKGRPSRPPSRPAHGTKVNTLPVQGRVSQSLAASLYSKDQATHCQADSSNPYRSPGLPFVPQVQTFQTRHAPETVTSCCKLQAARVWFRTTLQGRPSRPPSRPAHGTKVNTLPVQGRVSQTLAAALHSKDQATHCRADSSNPYRSPGLPFVPQMQTFQTRHAPETVTSCCKQQAAGVWFRTTLQGRPSRPPSRPAHGTKVNTLPVQGRVSQSLAASLHSKDQATHCQADSSNPYRSPGLPFVPQMQTFQTRHAPETVTSCCKLQAARVWFRTTLQGRPSRPPSRPAHGTNVNTLPVQGRVSQSLAASLHSKYQATHCQANSSNPYRSPGLPFVPQVQTFQTRHAPETVTICCKLQAARVWFRTALKGRPSRPPSRPAHGTNVNTLPVQGRVSQRLAASLHSKDQATHCQADSSNPYRSPGLPFMPQV